MLCTGYTKKEVTSMFLSWSTNISRLLHMHFGQVTTNQNKIPSIRTQYIVKMLHGRCYTKEAISLLLSLST